MRDTRTAWTNPNAIKPATAFHLSEHCQQALSTYNKQVGWQWITLSQHSRWHYRTNPVPLSFTWYTTEETHCITKPARLLWNPSSIIMASRNSHLTLSYALLISIFIATWFFSPAIQFYLTNNFESKNYVVCHIPAGHESRLGLSDQSWKDLSLSLLASTLEMILYPILQGDIGRKSFKVSGLSFFGLEQCAWNLVMREPHHPQTRLGNTKQHQGQ